MKPRKGNSAEEKLYAIFKEKLILTAVVTGSITIGLLGFFAWELWRFVCNGGESMDAPAAAVVAVVMLCVLTAALLPYWSDGRLVRKKQPKLSECTVLYLRWRSEPVGDACEMACDPVLLEEATGKRLVLKLDSELLSERRYLICYLPKTQLGVVVRELEEIKKEHPTGKEA